MKRNRFGKFFLIPAFLSAALISCERDENSLTNVVPNEGTHSVALSENSNSAAAQIAASEGLVIPAAIELPANLPNGNTRVATFFAIGVQKYKAQLIAGSNPAAYQWVFVAPQADLYDATNAKVGTHSAGPTWQLSALDSIYGQQYSPPKTAPSEEPGSIDWLLLKPKTGTIPTGIFADVAYIQRIATKGGKAPTIPPTSATKTIEVKYKAVYRFTKINP